VLQLILFGELASERIAHEREERRLHCLDCGVDTFAIHEFYIVHDVLWAAANPTVEGMLCILCLERRLDRTLSSDDFPDVPCNWWPAKSVRLKLRMPRFLSGPTPRDFLELIPIDVP
jgi:hypothetical protein